jgi:hypothetical protein
MAEIATLRLVNPSVTIRRTQPCFWRVNCECNYFRDDSVSDAERDRSRCRIVESPWAGRSSIERHAYSSVLAPYDMAAPMRPIGRESQREFVGDGGLADYLEHGSCVR